MKVPLQRRSWLQPFLALLRQGVSPEKIALTIALGIVLGVTPVLGSTLLLCTAASVAFGLNLPAIQLVNALVYPLQLLFLIPFYKIGARMFGADASTISLDGVLTLIQSGVPLAIRTLWVVTVHALAAWLILGAAACLILYVVLVPVIRRLWKRERTEAHSL